MNLYSIPPLLTALLTLVSGLIISIKGKKLSFCLVTTSVFVWLFGYALMYSVDSYETALLLAKILYMGVVFIPIFSYNFVVSFLKLKGRKKLVIFNGMIGFYLYG